jgi:tRNA-binding EMAP/Myf-like protein
MAKFYLNEVNLAEIIDCIDYAVEQIRTSAGDIQVLCRDVESCPKDQLLMAESLVDLKAELEEMRRVASTGKIVTIQI